MSKTLDELLQIKKQKTKTLDQLLNEKRMPNTVQKSFMTGLQQKLALGTDVLRQQHQATLEPGAQAFERANPELTATGRMAPERGLPGVRPPMQGVSPVPPPEPGPNLGAAVQAVIPGDYSQGTWEGLKRSFWSNPQNPPGLFGKSGASDLSAGLQFMGQHPIEAAKTAIMEPSRQVAERTNELATKGQIGQGEAAVRDLGAAVPVFGPMAVGLGEETIPQQAYGTPEEKAHAKGTMLGLVGAPELVRAGGAAVKGVRRAGAVKRLQKFEDQVNVALGNQIERPRIKSAVPYIDDYFKRQGLDWRNMDVDQVRDMSKKALDEFWSQNADPIQQALSGITVDSRPAFQRALDTVDQVAWAKQKVKAPVSGPNAGLPAEPTYIAELRHLVDKDMTLGELYEVRESLNKSLDNLYDKPTQSRENFLKTNPRARAYNEALNGVRELIDNHTDINAATYPGQTREMLKIYSDMKNFHETAVTAARANEKLKVAKNAERMGIVPGAVRSAVRSVMGGRTPLSTEAGAQAAGGGVAAATSAANMPDALIKSAGSYLDPSFFNPKNIIAGSGRSAMAPPKAFNWGYVPPAVPGAGGWTPPPGGAPNPFTTPPPPAGPPRQAGSMRTPGAPGPVQQIPGGVQQQLPPQPQAQIPGGQPALPGMSQRALPQGKIEVPPTVTPGQQLPASSLDVPVTEPLPKIPDEETGERFLRSPGHVSKLDRDVLEANRIKAAEEGGTRFLEKKAGEGLMPKVRKPPTMEKEGFEIVDTRSPDEQLPPKEDLQTRGGGAGFVPEGEGEPKKRVSPFMEARVEKEGGELKAQARMGRRGLEVLGSTAYSGQDIGWIVTKETIQNAMDSIKAKGDPSQGHMKVDVDANNKTVDIMDNGVGMSPDTVMKEFVEVGESYKPKSEGEAAEMASDPSGGLGMAKVAMFYNAEDLKLHTIHKSPKGGYDITTLTGNSESWLEPDVGFDVKTNHVESLQPGEETGTQLYIKLKPETRMDEQVVRKNLTDFQEAHKLPGKVETNLKMIDPSVGPYPGTPKTEPILRRVGGKQAESVGTLKSTDPDGDPGSNMDFYVQGEYKEKNYVMVHVMNNGLPQFVDEVNVGMKAKMPEKIIVDVKATGQPNEPNYPFSINRESLRADAKTAVKKFIQDKLAAKSFEKHIETIGKKIQDAPKITKDKHVLDGADIFTKEYATEVADSAFAKSYVNELQPYFNDIQRKLADLTEVPDYMNAKFSGISLGEGHLGVNIKIEGIFKKQWWETKPSVPIPDSVKKFFGDPNKPNDPLKHGVYFNPFIILKQTKASGARSHIRHFSERNAATMIHELVHQESWGHDEDFSSALTARIADSYHWVDHFANRIEKILSRNDGAMWRELNELNDKYNSKTSRQPKREGATDIFGAVSTNVATEVPKQRGGGAVPETSGQEGARFPTNIRGGGEAPPEGMGRRPFIRGNNPPKVKPLTTPFEPSPRVPKLRPPR